MHIQFRKTKSSKSARSTTKRLFLGEFAQPNNSLLALLCNLFLPPVSHSPSLIHLHRCIPFFIPLSFAAVPLLLRHEALLLLCRPLACWFLCPTCAILSPSLPLSSAHNGMSVGLRLLRCRRMESCLIGRFAHFPSPVARPAPSGDIHCGVIFAFFRGSQSFISTHLVKFTRSIWVKIINMEF